MSADRAVTRRLASRLGPGAWVDTAGALHFSLPELLAALAIEDTPANREELRRVIRDVMLAELPDVAIVETD